MVLEEAARRLGPDVDDYLVLLLAVIKKACPDASRELCWAVLAREGMPQHVIELLRRLRSTTSCTVRTKQGDSSNFTLLQGLREGCPTSCVVYKCGAQRCIACSAISAARSSSVLPRGRPAPATPPCR